MIISILQDLGFSLNEAKIYETLLDIKEGGVGEISSKSKVHRRNAYDALNRLVDKGLISSIITKGENLYSPVDPDKLLDLVKEKETSLNKILPEMRLRYEKKGVFQEACIYRGTEGFKNYMRDILRVGDDVYVIGAKLSWLEPKLKNYTEGVLREMSRKKITFHILFDAQVKERSSECGVFGKNYRFLPKELSSDSTLNIFGDYIVSYLGSKMNKIDGNSATFVLRDQNLADSYKKWFQLMWNGCKK